MTERAEILLPTPIMFPPMIGAVEVGAMACGVDIASLEASVAAGGDPSEDGVAPL